MSSDYIQYAKERVKAERELKIEQWVSISIERRTPGGDNEKLYRYDIPRRMLEKWQWAIRWRCAKLQCRFPRSHIMTYYGYYDKRTGLETGFGSLLGKLSAAKAQITKVERAIAEYIDCQTQNNMFFDIETDEMLFKAKGKLERKKANYKALYAALEGEVKQQQRDK